MSEVEEEKGVPILIAWMGATFSEDHTFGSFQQLVLLLTKSGLKCRCEMIINLDEGQSRRCLIRNQREKSKALIMDLNDWCKKTVLPAKLLVWELFQHKLVKWQTVIEIASFPFRMEAIRMEYIRNKVITNMFV